MEEHLLSLDGIVLQGRNFSERDRYIELLTKELGRISVFCRQARGRNARYLALSEAYTCARFELYRGKGRYSLNSAESRRRFPALRSDLMMQTAAAQMTEILFDLLPRNEEGESVAPSYLEEAAILYRLFGAALYSLDEKKADPLLIAHSFAFKALFPAGLAPLLQGDRNSSDQGEDARILFSFEERAVRFLPRNGPAVSEREGQGGNAPPVSGGGEKELSPRPSPMYGDGRREAFTTAFFPPKEEGSLAKEWPLSPSLYQCLLWLEKTPPPRCFCFSLNERCFRQFSAFMERYLTEQMEKNYPKLRELQKIAELLGRHKDGGIR